MNTHATLEAGLLGARRTGMMTYATVATALVAVIFLTNWPSYQYAVRGGMIPLWFYVIPAALVLPVIFAEPSAVVRPLRDPIFWWLIAFVATGLIWLLPAQDFIDEASRQWRLRVLALMYFYTISILAGEANRRTVGWVILACVLVACAFNWIDVLRPHRFVPQGIEGIEGTADGRGAGLYINPNAAASFVVMGTIGALPMIPARLRGLLIVAAVFGVAATFSRGGFVLVTVMLLAAVALKLVSRGQRILLVVGLPLLIGGVSIAYDYLIDASDNRNMHNIVQRLAWFQEMDEEDSAVEGRRYGATQAWHLFLESPVTGRGVGVTSLAVRQEGPHNMYLSLMAEQGVLGLFLYVSLIAIFVRRGWRTTQLAATPHDQDVGRTMIAFGLFLGVYGFFSHNVMEEPHNMFILAFIAAAGFHATRANRPILSNPAVRAPVRRPNLRPE